MWRILLPLCLLVHISSQDLVTTPPPAIPTAPVEELPEVPSIEKPKVKPTIRSLHVTSDIKYRYATTLVSSRVVNPSDQAAEAAFSITLPESAFISEFLMVVKDKVYKAYVKEKEEAKAVYDQAVQQGQFAGHVALDARDSNQFTVSVNVEAHGKVVFNLTYEQLLSRKLGVYSNVININPQQIVEDMSVTVNIVEPSTIKDLEVPELQTTNEISEDVKENKLAQIEEVSPKHKRVIWAPTPEEQKSQNTTGLSGQFIVKYDVDRKDNPQQILVDEGYFVHFFAPEDLPKLKKHVVFVLDFSGSMAGRKLDQLKGAMDTILSDLDERDMFSIVIFQSFIEAWSPKKIYSTASAWELEHHSGLDPNVTLDVQFVNHASKENIDLARSYLANYSDLGGTNIMGGLRTGLELVEIGSEGLSNESDAPQPVIIFLTDGQPNIEEYDTNVIINKTTHLNTRECPIFSLAFGYGADLDFLRKLSLSNNGFARNIYEAADASAQLKNFYRTVASPLLSNVTFNYLPGQVNLSSNTKDEFPVYFKGSEMVVAGRIAKSADKEKKTIGEISVKTDSGPKMYPINIECCIIDDPTVLIHPGVEPRNRTVGHLEKTWAYLTIQQLLDRSDALDDGVKKNETKAEALKLALQYSFVTPLTSLVVVKPNETASSVDTTKVKPGSEVGSFAGSFGGAGAGGFGGPLPALAALPAPGFGSSGGFPAVANRHPLPTGMPMFITTPFPPKLQSQPMPNAPDTVDGTESADKASLVQKVPFDSVKWLQQYLVNRTSDNVTVTVQGHEYLLGLNQTDTSFGECKVQNTSGECRHIQYCALSVFQENISEFIPYQCPIKGDFLGVCCVEHIK